jgi:Uma2 family endonuclease
MRDPPLWEVVNGQKVEKRVSIYAARLATRLVASWEVFLERVPIGTPVVEGVFVLDREADLQRRPDVAFVSAERWPMERPLPQKGEWEVVPDLVVEVVSPHDTLYAVAAKRREYFRHGVREVWNVVPSERTIAIYRAGQPVIELGPDDELATDLIPGWRLPVAQVFPK